MSLTLTIADNGDFSHATATISGSGGGFNSIYTQPAGSSSWTLAGSRVGDGTVTLTVGPGTFNAYVLSGFNVANGVAASGVTNPTTDGTYIQSGTNQGQPQYFCAANGMYIFDDGEASWTISTDNRPSGTFGHGPMLSFTSGGGPAGTYGNNQGITGTSTVIAVSSVTTETLSSPVPFTVHASGRTTGKQADILNGIASMLINGGIGLTELTTVISLHPFPPIIAPSDLWVSIQPTNGTFDQGQLDGGMCTEDTIVSIHINSRLLLDEVGLDSQRLTNATSGMLELKQQILKMLTWNDPVLGSVTLLRDPLLPDSTNIQPTQDETIGRITLNFRVLFDWDLS